MHRQAHIVELDDVDTLADRWEDLSDERKRVVLAAIIDKVTVFGVGKGWRRKGADITDRVKIEPRDSGSA